MNAFTIKLLEGVTCRVNGLNKFSLQLHSVWSEILLATVDIDHRQQFTESCYSNSSEYYVSAKHMKLFDWEMEVIDEYFPKAPARILIGGCGRGREVLNFLKMGYEVICFDPCTEFITDMQLHIKDKHILASLKCTYEDLIDDDSIVEQFAPFDAFLFGWGSFAHIMDNNQRDEILRVAKRICPNGPIVLSWPRVAGFEVGPKTKALRSILEFIGLDNHKSDDSYHRDSGFVKTLNNEIVSEMAKRTGYTAHFPKIENSYPFAVMT